MRILIIRNYPSYMDVSCNTYNIQEVGLAKALIRKGHQCDVVFWTDKDEQDVQIKVDKCTFMNIFYRKSIVIFKNAIFKNIEKLISEYDIIQPCEYNQYQAMYLAKKYPDKTVIYHGPYYSAFNKKYNLMCKIFDAIYLRSYIKKDTKFIVKSNLAKEFLESKGIKTKNITVSGVGIDIEMLSTPKDYKEIDFINTIKNSKYERKLLYIGRWEKRRNIKFLFDTLKKIIDLGYNIGLVMIGSGDIEYKQECIQYAKEIGVYSRILYLDKLEQKYLSSIYKECDIFLLPTLYEIFGMVLLEAMYYGLPVITTHNGGSDILINNRVNGFIEELDCNKWSQAIIELLDNNEKRRKIGQIANETITDNYTWDSVVESIIKAYLDRME
ncbi:glycosyltransferase family 4 protein [Paraclostridium bifermentans]|uniref:glycosyltransferase family 4 protein n=1 Tax=Paraclostridium bifermentans TaxID=1490 RepID=UPI00189DA773|nr:glycosyltransferase family 4 protein [Paraclostridium bifermentans]